MAKTFYVSPNGNDGSSGTEAQPFRTISQGVQVLAAGDTLLVKNGTYVEVVTVRTAGTAAAPISIRAFPGHSPVIDGQAGMNGPNSGLPATGDLFGTESRDGTGFRYGPLVSIEANYIVFEGFTVTRSMGRGIRVWRNDQTVTGVEIRNCKISFSRESGLLLEVGCDGVTIVGCDVSRSGNFAPYNRSPHVLNHPGGLALKGADNILIQQTIVRENWGEGIIFDAVNAGSQNVIVRQCIVYDNKAPSIYVHGTRNALVERNLVYHSVNNEFDNNAGIAITPPEPNFEQNSPTENITIRNNIVVGFDSNIALWPSSGRKVSRLFLLNNTLVNGLVGGIHWGVGPFEACEYRNNLVYQGNGKPPISTNPDFVGWTKSNNSWSTAPQSGASSPTDVIGNPLLQNPDTTLQRGQVNPDWYRITSNSPVRGKALILSSVKDDYFGSVRDTTPDMGATEFVTETIKADFTALPPNGQAPLQVAFKDKSTSSQAITGWLWDFGDGSVSDQQSPTHTYSAGTYTVSLRVSNSVGSNIVTRSNLIKVEAVIPNTPPRVTNGLQVLYSFDQRSGNTIYDISGEGTPLDLVINNPAKVKWTSEGLSILEPTLIVSNGPAEKINEACRQSNEVTVEVWCTPANTTQEGPARIVSLSQNVHSRNLTLGQGLWGSQPNTVFDVRLRTTERSANGMPSVTSPVGTAKAQKTHIVYTRKSNGLVRLIVDNVVVAEANVPGDLSTWNPRFPLLLGNETTGEYPWRGQVFLVAMYNRFLSKAEVGLNFAAGPESAAMHEPTSAIWSSFKRFVLVNSGQNSVFHESATTAVAYGVQYPDERCVVCTSNGAKSLTIYNNVNKVLSSYNQPGITLEWLD